MSLASISIKRPIFITCVVTLMLVLGGICFNKMSVDLFPDVTLPVVFVQTLYPGASPVDMERLVSKPIEDELGSIAGLNKITSTNSDSVSSVVLEFKIGTDIKDVEQQVRQRLGNIRRDLPDEIKDPVVKRFDPSDQPVVRLAVSSELPPAKLFDVVDQIIKNQFETLAGVGQVTITGARKQEIHVNVDKNKLDERTLSLVQVVDKIKNTSKDVPVGTLQVGPGETTMRATGEFADLNALKEVNVNFLGSDQVVKLSSIASVTAGLEEEKSQTTLMTKANGYKKAPAIFLDVFKQSGANTVMVVDLAKSKIDKINALLVQRKIPAHVDLVRDGAEPIRLNIADVRESILIGILLCVLVVFFFLGSARSTFITGMALPNSLLGGFVIMYMMGFTINILTLLALSLAVGLLIDDAIVVRENIFRHLEMGKSPKQAALDGTKEVTLAVTATTLVVIAVFGPIAFLEGTIGQFFRQFGLTVVFTMLISLFDALTIAPMLSAYLATKHEQIKGRGPIARLLIAFDQLQTKLENLYEHVLKFAIRRRLLTLSGAGLIFIFSLFLIKYIPKTFLPSADNGEFQVSIETPVKFSLDGTKEVTGQIEDVIRQNPAIETMATVVGSNSGAVENNKSSIYVHLTPSKQRSVNTTQVKEALRAQLKPFSDRAIIGIGDIDIGGGDQKIFNLAITGDDLDQLSQYVDKLKVRMQKIKGLVDIDTNYRTGKPEFHIEFDRNKSENLGVSTVIAGTELRDRVEGGVPATYRENGIEYDIRVRLNEEDRDLRKNFNTTFVPNTNYNMIPLNKIATGKDILGYSQINRQNKSRYVNIDANLGPDGNLGDITSETERLLNEDPEYKLPVGLSYRFVGQAEDFKDLMVNMVTAMGLGILFIYLVLSSLYESFITPFAILLALPMALCGVFLALLMTGKGIDIFSLIGIVMLLGVVAKNSILLVDYTNQLMQEGVARNEALIRAGKTRLRPIMMTSLALIAGTIPIAVGLNEASAQRTSMGVAIIGGLITSTLLTLLVVPAAFGYIDDFRVWTSSLFARTQGVDVSVETPHTSET